MNSFLRYALFRCCTSAPHMPEYELATDLVLSELEIDMVSIPEFGCCGYPLRNVDQMAWLLSSARNLALAEDRDSSIITVCNCCYGTLKHCAWILSKDSLLKSRVNESLVKEGLSYTGKAKVRHLFEVLKHDIGLESLKEKIRNPFSDLNLAVHYGCRILRPSRVLEMDNPFKPSMLDDLISTTGAGSVDWGKKLDCCGAPIMATDEKLSAAITLDKISSAREAGADAICVACPFCKIRLGKPEKNKPFLPVVAYPQLLARCLGVDSGKLKLEINL